MTTPQGPSGLNPGASWVVTGNDGSVSGLPARTQDNVTATLKTQMRQSNAWKGSSTAVWEGLRPGVPLTLATIEAIAKRLLGIDDKTWDTVEGVLHDLQKVPILGDIIEVLTGIEDGDYNDLGTWVNRLLTGDSALNAANLFGLLDPSSLPAIEIGRLFKGEYGLIADGGFALPPLGSVDTGEWFWDNTIGVTANGCAGIIGDGATHDLIGQPIGVRAGQPFTFDTFVRWKDASVTAGAKPLQLLVIEFAGQVQVGEVAIASVSTTGSLLTFQRLDGGDYTVPDGVDSICPTVRVTADLLTGNVWVDDAQNDTLGHILLSWIIGPDGGTMATLFDLFASMGELLNNTGTTQADWETWWHDLFVALGLGDANSLTVANWLADVWFSIVHPIKVVLGLFVDMGDLLNDSTATQADWELWFSEVFETVGMPTANASKAATWIADGWFSIVHPIRQILDQFSELQVLLNNPDAVQADWEDWLLDLFDLVIPSGTANARIAHWLAKVWFELVEPVQASLTAINDDIDAKNAAWQSFLQAGWEALSNPSFPQKIAALQSAWDTFAAEMGDIEADQTLTIQKILNQFIPGLFPDGQNPTGLTGAWDFFDSIRRSLNQMFEWTHSGYWDANWQWVTSLTVPSDQLPGSGVVMTPGRNDDDTPAISSGVDVTIPGKPTGLVAIPWLDLSVSGFPAGKITYAIAAVRNGIEGPAAFVTVFAGTLVPPNCSGRVDLAYTAPADGADSYRIYRQVDATYTAQPLDWRLVATPTHDYPMFTTPLSDKTVRTSGVTAHPKTDAELSAQIVTSVQSTADSAQTAASVANTNAGLAQSAATAADTKATNAASAASTADGKAVAAQSTATTANTGVNAIVSGAGKATPAATGNFLADTWSNLVSGWNNMWDGIFGTSGSTGKTASDVKTAASSVASSASVANTNAGLAQTAATTADTKARTIQAGLYGGTPSAPAAVGSTIVVGAVPTGISPAKIASVGSGANLGEDVTGAVDAASLAGGKATAAQQANQDVIDAINNASSGANTTGTSIDSIQGNLQRFPQQNIKINPAAGSNAAVAFDAAGAGASTGPFQLTQYGTSVSWSHTVGASGNYIFIAAYYPAPLSTGSPSFSAVATPAVGGAPVQITAVDFTSAPADLVILAAPIDPGTYTITLTCRISGVGVTAPGFIANSVSYTNVNTVAFVESPTTAGGYSTSGTNSTPMSFSPQAQTDADTKDRYVNVFGNASTSASGAISAYTGGTSRLNKSATIGSGGMGLVIGDVIPNGSNESFSATAASASNNVWQGVGFLLESDSSTVGSFMELSRQTTGDFTVGSSSVMPTPIPNNTYDTIVRHTDDLTAVGANGTNQLNGIKVSLAGTYILTVQHVWGSNTASKLIDALGVKNSSWPAWMTFASTTFKCVPLVNGAQVPEFMPGTMSFPLVSPGTSYASAVPPAFSTSCVLYLKPGDVVSWAGGFDAFYTVGPAPGYVLTYKVPFDVAGIATDLTKMSLALSNRSLL